MRILITGGAGFIGSHLAERLVGQGHEVVVWDCKQWDDWPLFQNQQVVGVRGDCKDTSLLDKPGIDHTIRSCDFIYHLAATVGVKRVLEDPSECIENNVASLRAVLNLGIPGLFTSTSEVYGTNDELLREDSRLVYSQKPRWSYAASKLIGEWMALQAGWKVVRLFNVVGPRQSTEYGAVLPNFVKQALAGEPLTVYGSGDQVRTFIDVRDCVEILDRLREKTFDVVNLGGQHVMSIRQLAHVIYDTFKWTLPIVRIPYPDVYPPGFDECPCRIPDPTKLDSVLPERPVTDFSKTIRDLAASLRSREVVSA